MQTTRNQRRLLAKQSAKQPEALQEIPQEQWPVSARTNQLSVWRSREFLVQEFPAPAPAVARLSVNRTSVSGSRWDDNITWDELQEIKRQVGYGNATAVEVFPPQAKIVNVANMRHLWILADTPAFVWREA